MQDFYTPSLALRGAAIEELASGNPTIAAGTPAQLTPVAIPPGPGPMATNAAQPQFASTGLLGAAGDLNGTKEHGHVNGFVTHTLFNLVPLREIDCRLLAHA